MNRTLTVGNVTFNLRWSGRLKTAPIKFCGNDVSVSLKLIRSMAALERAIRTTMAARTTVIDDSARFWIRGKLLGQGGFSSVYACKNAPFAAIKVYKSKSTTEDVKEAAAYAALGSSSSIPRMFGVGIDNDGHKILVLERFDGDLFTQLKNNAYGYDVKLEIASAVVDALAYIHDRGKVHCDVKPQNVFVSAQPFRVVLGDFGLLKDYASAAEYGVDPSARRYGTLAYMSVDVHNRVPPTRRSDLESAGWVFVELFGGTLPWRGLTSFTETLNLKTAYKAAEFIDEFFKTCGMRENVPPLRSYLTVVWSLGYNDAPSDYASSSFLPTTPG